MSGQRITVIADTNSQGVLPLYSGLRAFCRRNAIPLRYRPWGTRAFRDHRPGILCIEIEADDRTRPLLVCFDMHDSGAAFLRERLEQCDLYFKRSFDPAAVGELPPMLARKIRPYGVFSTFADSADPTLLRRISCEVRARRRAGMPIGSEEISSWLLLLSSSWAYAVSPGPLRRKLVPPERTLTRAAGLGRGVLFQTRAWGPDEVPHEKNIDAINAARVATVRALRDHFGPRFLGGLIPTPYAQKHYPDLLTTQPADRPSYFKLLGECRVSVITLGIHRSTQWKMAESLAAARCIVSEPHFYEVPIPFRDGRNYLLFHTPDQCVAACERLLADDDLAAEMQNANRSYYAEHASAAAAVERCLKLAMNPCEPQPERSHAPAGSGVHI